MNYLDIILSIFLISGLINGVKNGFFVELASLVSILLGIYIAIKFSYVMKAYLEHHGSWDPKTIQVAAFALTFLLVIIAVSLLARFFTSVANFASLGIFNTLLGGIFGMMRTVLMISIGLNLLQKINYDHTFLDEETMEQSRFYQPIETVSKMIYPAIDDWFTAFKEKDFKLEQPED